MLDEYFAWARVLWGALCCAMAKRDPARATQPKGQHFPQFKQTNFKCAAFFLLPLYFYISIFLVWCGLRCAIDISARLVCLRVHTATIMATSQFLASHSPPSSVEGNSSASSAVVALAIPRMSSKFHHRFWEAWAATGAARW